MAENSLFSGSGRVNGWRQEAVFDIAEQHFRSMQEGIEQAKTSIELAVYIFELDEVGEPLVQKLRQAAQRGVQVRVLVDGVGSARSAFELGELLTGVGAEFHVYHPLPWYWDTYRWSLSKGRWWQKFWYFFNVVNRRDHRKFLIVDGVRAWCGNFNIAADHLGKRLPWRDYGASVEGPAVAQLLANFNQVWREQGEPREDRRVRLGDFQFCWSNLTLRQRWVRNRKLASTIRKAKQRVWICNAYFSPSPVILRAIRAASRKSLDIRLIVAGRSDIVMFPLLTSTYYADLLKMGVRIYQYEAGVLHAKVLLADQQCVIGSTNFNHRSFYHDLELDVVLTQQQSIDRIERGLLTDMEGAKLIGWGDVGPVSRSFWFGWLPRLLRYWM